MIDGDHRPVHHHAHEADGSRLRRGDRGAVDRRPQVHAAVTAQPRLGRGSKARSTAGLGRQGPAPAGAADAALGRRLPRTVEVGPRSRRPVRRGRGQMTSAASRIRGLHAPSLPAPRGLAGQGARRLCGQPRAGKESRPTNPATARRPPAARKCVRSGGAAVVHLVEQFAVPSTLPGRRFKSLSGRLVLQARSSQHVSFRGAGEQRLTTRIQPSSYEAENFRCGGLCLLRSVPYGPDGKRSGCQEQRPPGRS